MQKVGNIIACLIVYNDFDILPECMDSLSGADKIIIIDGAFKDYPHEKPWSTDGTVDYVKQRASIDRRIKFIECKKAWKDEVEKRSAYFTGKQGDWYLIVDSDERVGGETIDRNGVKAVKEFLPTYEDDMLDVPLWELISGSFESAPRLFRHQEGIRYYLTHYLVFYKDKLLVNDSKKHKIFDGMKIWHMPDLRTDKRNSTKETFYRKMSREDLQALDNVVNNPDDYPLDMKDIKYIKRIRMRHIDLMKSRGWD